ncbi:hypothetical protein F0P96_01530 [Hymenobacter busanensis]|uniref:DUF4440 domain-containing protein n=1 Tax=Hymenobacter busanensis TaxID=2607656 RepID=A0A7L4ZU29_9BACT|nr:DUF4440 domain-containing protein [Hymenobacter busanensis]KAA9339334.1 hypothetical protein F0P96_01530 [Hymenobacter busanensis]QHJ06904.1 hypothetical protein GUY19_06220 [Hymenobacter busanensis]
MRTLRLLVAASLLLTVATAHAQHPADAFVAAERAFARLGAEAGAKAAFLANAADSGLVFNNGKPVLARQAWASRPDQPDGPKIIWAPAFADASQVGDLGYTTGPFWVQTPTGQRVAHGQFFTVWRRQPDGTLKFLADMGVTHPAPTAEVMPTEVSFGSSGQLGSDGKLGTLFVRRLDEQLTKTIARRGMAKAYAEVAGRQLRLHRDGQVPFTSPTAIQQLVQAEKPLQFQPTSGAIARSGDLGYTCGSYQGGSEQGSYLHVWKHETKGWRLAAEVLNPTRPPKPQ